MSSAQSRVPQVRNPTLPSQTTAEQRFWRGYTNPQIVKENYPISHIHFNPAAPHDFAVTSSTRIQIFSSKTRQVVRTFLRFRDTVYLSEFRYDGKLLVAADALGLVLIYDTFQLKNLLVSLNPLAHATHVAKFHPHNGQQLATGSDDRTLRLYDISQTSNGPIILFGENYHTDYIRSVLFVPGNPNLVATGCYDGYVRVFDTRASNSLNAAPIVAQFSHQGTPPVEDVLALSPTTIVSAAGPLVRAWDLARLSQIHELNNFTKTVTCLNTTGELNGLLVGSLDGHVKIFDTASAGWDVKFGWKFGSGGVLSTAVSPNQKHFVTGLTLGLLSIRTRKTEPKAAQGVKTVNKTGGYMRMMRGADYLGEEEHHIVQTATTQAQQKKLKQFERHLNAFRWSDALDSAFATGLPKEQTITVLNELKRSGKVRIALHGRDEISLLPILQWFVKNLDDIRSINLICDYIGVILEMYGSLIGKSGVLEEVFTSLLKRVNAEVKKCQEAKEIEGMLELLTV